MSDKSTKHSENVEGLWFCTSGDGDEACIACAACYSDAPDFFASDGDGNAYVIKQPTTDEEISECESAMENCPVVSIGNDG